MRELLVNAARYSAPGLLLVAIGFLLFTAVGRDDSHITYWEAYSAANFGELVNYSGDRVEQSSSLLHVLLLASAHLLTGIDIVMLGKLSSIVAGALVPAAVYVLTARIDPRAAMPAAVFTALTPYLLYWSFGGLETTMVALLATATAIAYGQFLAQPSPMARSVIGAGITTVAFVLVRPESPVVVLCVLVGALIILALRHLDGDDGADPKGLVQRVSILLMMALGVTAALLLFRYVYFGSLFPQPVAVKATGLSIKRIFDGLDYLFEYMVAQQTALMALVVAGFLYSAVILRRSQVLSPYLLISLLFAVASLAFIVMAGGDWMEAGRFLVPVVPFGALHVALLLSRTIQTASRHRASTLLVVALSVWGILQLASSKSTGSPLWVGEPSFLARSLSAEARDYTWFERRNREHTRDIPTIAALRKCIDRISASREGRVTLMSGQVGMVLYHTVGTHYGGVTVMDRYGLACRTFSDCTATSDAARTAFGLWLPYGELFSKWPRIEAECGHRRPDVIFDLDIAGLRTDILKNGYSLVYLQTGEFYSGSEAFPGSPITGAQFIAVRSYHMHLFDGDTLGEWDLTAD